MTSIVRSWLIETSGKNFCVAQALTCSVLRSDQWLPNDGPQDADRGIVPRDTALDTQQAAAIAPASRQFGSSWLRDTLLGIAGILVLLLLWWIGTDLLAKLRSS